MFWQKRVLKVAEKPLLFLLMTKTALQSYRAWAFLKSSVTVQSENADAGIHFMILELSMEQLLPQWLRWTLWCPHSVVRVPGFPSLLCCLLVFFWGTLGSSRGWLTWLGPCCPHERPRLDPWLLALVWPSPAVQSTEGGGEAVNGKSPSLFLYVCVSLSLENKQNNFSKAFSALPKYNLHAVKLTSKNYIAKWIFDNCSHLCN